MSNSPEWLIDIEISTQLKIAQHESKKNFWATPTGVFCTEMVVSEVEIQKHLIEQLKNFISTA